MRGRELPDHARPGPGVLPFGNQSATANVDGVQLKEFLETAVSPPPATGIGRFGQVSGLCSSTTSRAPPETFRRGGTGNLGTGNRVHKVVRQAADGTCDFVNGAVVGLTAGDHYTLTINDFMMTGGDGYPNVRTTGCDAGHPRPGSCRLHRHASGEPADPGHPASHQLLSTRTRVPGPIASPSSP